MEIQELKRQVSKAVAVYSSITNQSSDRVIKSITATRYLPEGKQFDTLNVYNCKMILAHIKVWLEMRNYKFAKAIEGIEEQYTPEENDRLLQEKIDRSRKRGIPESLKNVDWTKERILIQ